MKTSLRDHLTIMMAFATVFLCGLGIGKLLSDRQTPAVPIAPEQTTWEAESLVSLRDSLRLDPAELQKVQKELASTATRIEETRADAVFSYHRHIHELYTRLIEELGEPRAAHLRQEKYELEKAMQKLNTKE